MNPRLHRIAVLVVLAALLLAPVAPAIAAETMPPSPATGAVSIGEDTIRTGRLDRYSELTAALDASLAADGDLLLYGSLVARDGAGTEFVTAMSTSGDVRKPISPSSVSGDPTRRPIVSSLARPRYLRRSRTPGISRR